MSFGAQETVATMVAEYLKRQQVERVYGLSGGHVQPLWDAAARAGIRIVDVRHEASAVYMAQAESMLTGGIGVALVTAGPGLMNAITAIANASVSGATLLVLSGRPPRPQAGRGAMQDIPQAETVAPLCRRVECIDQRHHVLTGLDTAVAAAVGSDAHPGPAYIDFPVDLFDEGVRPAEPDAMTPRRAPPLPPGEEVVNQARALIARARRPLVITGRLPEEAVRALGKFLDESGALYLDTAEGRGMLPKHLGYVPAMRSQAMREADLVITLARRLDFQLGYGSSAVFSSTATWLRIGRSFAETGENKRGDVEVRADVGSTLAALSPAELHEPDRQWAESLRADNAHRAAKLSRTLAEPPTGSDGRMHPYQLIAALNAYLDERGIVVADGGDILSFARVALAPARYLDCGALGCLGVGVPFATAAALSHPDRRVVALIGDGSFGFTALDVNTAVRHAVPALFVVANNEAWNIERQDQEQRYDGNLVGVELPHCRYDLVARGLGAYAERIEHPDQLTAAIKRGLENAPAVLDVLVTRDAVSPDFRNGLASVPTHQALGPWNEAELAR